MIDNFIGSNLMKSKLNEIQNLFLDRKVVSVYHSLLTIAVLQLSYFENLLNSFNEDFLLLKLSIPESPEPL